MTSVVKNMLAHKDDIKWANLVKNYTTTNVSEFPNSDFDVEIKSVFFEYQKGLKNFILWPSSDQFLS